MAEKQRLHEAIQQLNLLMDDLNERIKTSETEADVAFYNGYFDGVNHAKNIILDVWEDSAEGGL